MYQRGLFAEWVPKPLQLVFIIIMLITVFSANALFLGNSPSMAGSMGILSEDIMMAYYASTIGMILVMPIIMRIKLRYKARQLMFISFPGMALLSIVSATTNEPAVLVAANLLFGALKVLAMIEVIVPIMFIISPSGERAAFYSVFYPISIGLGTFSTFLAAEAAYDTNWQFVYIYSLMLLGLCMIIVVVFSHNAYGSKKIPLYGIDWPSPLLLAIALLALDYVLSYGQVMDWLNSYNIQVALFGSILPLLLFTQRQLVLKRPFIDLAILKRRNVTGALCLIFMMGMFFATSGIQSAFTSVLKYNSTINAALNMFSIIGAGSGGVVCYIWFSRHQTLKPIVLMGFMSYLIYHVILYFLFSPVIEFAYLVIPGILKGLGMTLIYISIGIYAAQGLTMATMLSSSTFLILFRSFIGPAFFGAIYANQLYEGIKVHGAQIVQNMDSNDAFFQARYAPAILSATAQGNSIEAAQSSALQSISSSVQAQATLSASKEIFGYIILTGSIVIILLLFYRFTPVSLRRIIELKQKFRRKEIGKNEEEIIGAIAP